MDKAQVGQDVGRRDAHLLAELDLLAHGENFEQIPDERHHRRRTLGQDLVRAQRLGKRGNQIVEQGLLAEVQELRPRRADAVHRQALGPPSTMLDPLVELHSLPFQLLLLFLRLVQFCVLGLELQILLPILFGQVGHSLLLFFQDG